jgi:zinc/manganese transport system substrate-binding protein
VIGEIRRRYPGAPAAYTERVPGYLLAAAGLRVLTPPGFAAAIEDGTNPSPDDTVAMDGLFTGREVRVLLYNAQVVSPVTQHVEALARTRRSGCCPAGSSSGAHRDHAAALGRVQRRGQAARG